jgi:hypothetical protein
VATVNATSGAAVGTFYERRTGEATFPFTVATSADTSGEDLMAVSVKTPLPGLTCTLLFSAPAADVEAVLGPLP